MRHFRQTTNRRLGGLLLALLVAGAAGPLWADSWPGPRVMNVFSDNGRFFVRILPGSDIGATVGFAGAKRGAAATAEFYARQADRSYRLTAEVALLNPVAPVDALVSNLGYMITFDNWHNLGYGKVVAIYRPDGTNVASYELEQLHKSENVAKITRSVSSRYWRCAPRHFVDPDGQSLVYVRESLGGYFVFDLAPGTFRHTPGKNPECNQSGGPLSTTRFGR